MSEARVWRFENGRISVDGEPEREASFLVDLGRSAEDDIELAQVTAAINEGMKTLGLMEGQEFTVNLVLDDERPNWIDELIWGPLLN